MIEFGFCYLPKGRLEPWMAEMCIKSLRQVMPDSFITQFSNLAAPKIEGINAVVRNTEEEFNKKKFPAFMLNMILLHNFTDAFWIDCDLIFDQSIYEVADGDYEIAMCSRCSNDGKHLTFMQGGLWYTKDISFWEAVREEYFRRFSDTSKPHDRWMGGQVIMSEFYKECLFNFKTLDGNVYNRTPEKKGDKDQRVKVWHYKGMRKGWIKHHWRLLD